MVLEFPIIIILQLRVCWKAGATEVKIFSQHALRIRGSVLYRRELWPKIQQTEMLVTCQRFGDLVFFG